MTSEVWVWCWLPGDVGPTHRRMVFNCCISNTDNHERNHGFLAGDTPGRYMLSPAYDMVPRKHATQRREHALAMGQDGFVATRRNLLSDCAAFGLRPLEAERILDDVQARVQGKWNTALQAEGLGDEQLQEWANCFERLPDQLA